MHDQPPKLYQPYGNLIISTEFNPSSHLAISTANIAGSAKTDDLFEETLAAQTIQKAAQPSEANHFERRFPWEVAQTLLPKAGSLQRHQAKDCQVFRLMHDLQLPTKEETA